MALGRYGVMAGCGGRRAFTDQPSRDIFYCSLLTADGFCGCSMEPPGAEFISQSESARGAH